MKDLNRYVTRKYSTDWFDIGLELGLDFYKLEIIKHDISQDCVNCFQRTLDGWLSSTIDATWRTLEIALTNVNRAKLELHPIDDVYGKDILLVLTTLCWGLLAPLNFSELC